ncbi:hypothetical protein QQP08_008926 [Theobroma cacao]|nr:hypothetical protein QQP08_008926 [Theobroma cacao]
MWTPRSSFYALGENLQEVLSGPRQVKNVACSMPVPAFMFVHLEQLDPIVLRYEHTLSNGPILNI